MSKMKIERNEKELSARPLHSSSLVFFRTTIPLRPGLKIIPRLWEPLMYFGSLLSLAMSSESALVTRVAKKATAVKHSGLTLFAKYNNLAT